MYMYVHVHAHVLTETDYIISKVVIIQLHYMLSSY